MDCMTPPSTDEQRQSAILDFWFGSGDCDPASMSQRGKFWYSGGTSIDEEIKERFGALHKAACDERLTHWGTRSKGSLALVILLDQFSRNIHRGTRDAFEQDPLARAIAKRALRNEQDLELSIPERLFLIHPLHHSENLVDQEQAVAYVHALYANVPEPWREQVKGSLDYFVGHHDVVRRFRRFPHRNEVLGRESTDEEISYLANASRFGQ